MRKQFVILVILGLILFIAAWTQTDEKNIKETVSVLNIEVPVRVFYKGNPVDNLTKNDFSLIVNGRERDIIGFNIVRKQIEVQKLELEIQRHDLSSEILQHWDGQLTDLFEYANCIPPPTHTL